MIGHFTDDIRVLQFINSYDLCKLAPLGTSCPDHFLKTKIQPLVLRLKPDEDLSDGMSVRKKLLSDFEIYRVEYEKYYETHRKQSSPAMRDPNPVIILYPGIGMFSFAKDKATARIASEFYINAIQVMRGAETVSEYTALPRREAFDIEYWELEEAKLRRMPKDKTLSGKIALVTGAGGGIGKAIAEKLIGEGANVVFVDIDQKRLKEAVSPYSGDKAVYTVCDIRNFAEVRKACDKACIHFGGIDIIVHSAGMAISKSLTDTSVDDWNLLQDVLVKGQFKLVQRAVEIMRSQGLGGDIISIASKNGLVAGSNNVAYGTAKAAQQHMTRLLAAELGSDKIRANTINPDGVIVGSKIWEGEWAQGRAKTYGISPEELPEHYAKRNLLNEIILPEDIANAVFALVGILNKSTGNTINVDGGISYAFVR